MVMTIIDDIFDVRPIFKKRKTLQKDIELQIDKLMIKFYMRLEEHIRERNGEIEENSKILEGEREEEGKRLYLRIS